MPLLSSSVSAVNYFVSPTGSSAASGLDSANAWSRLDVGDSTGILNPGDTVFIYPGVYQNKKVLQLQTAGTSDNYIVYMKFGQGKVLIDNENKSYPNLISDSAYVKISGIQFLNAQDYGLIINGNATIIDNLSIFSSKIDGVIINGDSVLVENCKISDTDEDGIHIYGNYATIYRNIICSCTKSGIVNEDNTDDQTKIFHNTIHNNGDDGILLLPGVNSVTITNNIIVSNTKYGITNTDPSNTCSYNNVWGNPKGNYNGITSTGGEISSQPLFFDEANYKFQLLKGSPEINAGFDLGYYYTGTAPDIGAYEKYNVYYVNESGDNDNSGLSDSTAWLSITNGNDILAPGDTVYVRPGPYFSSVQITASGAALNDLIVFKGFVDSTILDGSGVIDSLIVLSGNFVELRGFTIENSSGVNIVSTGHSNVVSYCRITGAGTDGLYGNKLFTAHHNEFIDNSANGINMSNADSCKIYNNIFYNNNYGLVSSTSRFGQIFNNIFMSNSAGAIVANSLTDISYSLFFSNSENVSGGASIGFGCLFEDPRFVDTLNTNFRVNSSSPGIDAGLEYDFAYIGTAPDIGVYEAAMPNSFYIYPIFDSLVADTVYDFEVQALDSLGYPANYGTLTWEHTFSSGTIDNEGIFDPRLIGTGEIIVSSSYSSLVDTSVSMEVVPGKVNDLNVNPVSAIISTDSSIQFTLSGTDDDTNITTKFGTVTWTESNALGTIDSLGWFVPDQTGTTVITATSDFGPSAVTDSIEIIVGEKSYINVVPAKTSISEDSTLQFSAFSYDSKNNLISNISDSVTWSTNDPSGSISPTGLYTAGINLSPPLYYVKADYQTLSDSSEVTILADSSIAYVLIEYEDGTPVVDFTTNTDNDTTTFFWTVPCLEMCRSIGVFWEPIQSGY